jgi:hypothetical protein
MMNKLTAPTPTPSPTLREEKSIFTKLADIVRKSELIHKKNSNSKLIPIWFFPHFNSLKQQQHQGFSPYELSEKSHRLLESHQVGTDQVLHRSFLSVVSVPHVLAITLEKKFSLH